MYGYTREEYLDLRPEDFNCGTPPYTAENAQARIARAAAGEPQLFEWHAKRSNGELFWVEINLKRIAIGDRSPACWPSSGISPNASMRRRRPTKPGQGPSFTWT